MMKKKAILIISILVVVIIAVVLVLVLPLSFSDVISDREDLRIVIVEIDDEVKYDNGRVNEHTKEFVFSPDSTEFIQIQQILSRHSYHRSFRTFFSSDQSIILYGLDTDIYKDRYYFSMFSGESTVHTGQTNEIKVNNKVYNIGYFSNDTAFSMMDEIKSVLDVSVPYWENNLGVSPIRGMTYR